MSTIRAALDQTNLTAFRFESLGYWHGAATVPTLTARMLLGQPGLTILVPHTLIAPADIFAAAQMASTPTFILDDPRLHLCDLLSEGQSDLLNWTVERSAGPYPTLSLHPEYPPALTLATYGYNFELVRAAALELVLGYEIFCEIVLFSQLSPVEFEPLAASLASTRRLVTVESGLTDFGWGAELIARAAAGDIRRLKTRRVALAADSSAHQHPILHTVLELLGQKNR